MFRRIHIRTGSANFYPYNTPLRFVNNIPSSTVVQMAAFQFADLPACVGYRQSQNGQEPTYELHLTSKELDNFKLYRPPRLRLKCRENGTALHPLWQCRGN